MKTKGTIIFVVIVLVVVLCAIVFVPKIFPKNNGEEVTSLSTQTSDVSSVAPRIYSLEEMVAESDNFVSVTVIKADVEKNGVLYTLTVSWSDVLKCRNYATMGYAFVSGNQTLELNKTYFFIGDTNEEKYHYKEPFEKAPWVFAVNDDKTLTHVSNGDVSLVSNLSDITIEKVKNICKNMSSSK